VVWLKAVMHDAPSPGASASICVHRLMVPIISPAIGMTENTPWHSPSK
jgi:hypothetical protein